MTAIRPLPAPLDRARRLGVLISGGGSRLQNFVDRIAAHELPAEVALVVASQGRCGGVDRARRAGLSCDVVERRSSASAAEYSEAIFALCREARVDLVTLAGFLALLEVPEDFRLRVMNIHPALIPAFCGQGYYGHRVHEAVLERGAKITGCTVHFADNHYDHGPIVLQRCVSVHDDHDADTLARRVFAADCEAYPVAIRLSAAGRLHDDGRHLRAIDPQL